MGNREGWSNESDFFEVSHFRTVMRFFGMMLYLVPYEILVRVRSAVQYRMLQITTRSTNCHYKRRDIINHRNPNEKRFNHEKYCTNIP